MADNINVTEGSGRIIAADDIGGILWQRIKMCFGVDGTATDVSASNPLPTVDAAGNTLLGTMASALASVVTQLGGLATSAAQATMNTALGTLVTQTVGLATSAAQATMNSALATIAGAVPVAVEIAVNFTRPADTTGYTIGDAVSNSTSAPTVLTFANIARVVGGSGYITKARVMTDQSGNTARFRIHLYNVAPTAINDNAVQTLLYANRAGYVGSIDVNGLATEGTGSTGASSINNSPRLPFTTNGSSSLYGLVEVLDAFTPASLQNFFVALMAEQN